jgi:uncharacterized protein YacL
MPVVLLRCVYGLLSIALAGLYIALGRLPAEPAWAAWAIGLTPLVMAGLVMALDAVFPRKRLEVALLVYAGLLGGLLLAAFGSKALGSLPLPIELQAWLRPALALALCYGCTSVLLQSRHEFRALVPSFERVKAVGAPKPYVLDTSVIIDGRIADVVETGIMDGRLIVPSFVIAELQSIADSSERLRRTRGRRGLDILNRLRSSAHAQLQIDERELPTFDGQPVDLKLVLLAKHLAAKVMTQDFNLNKIAQLHGVEVVNLNDLAGALKPVFLPGETLDVLLLKPGEGAGQAVGYLDDGTMIVVEAGRPRINQTVTVTVTSVLQTSAGRMIFGR